MSYLVTENPGACHEVHLGPLTNPRETYYHEEGVNASYCHVEIRVAAETVLYLAATCEFDQPHSQTFPRTPEKYAVDLSRPTAVRRIDENTWQFAKPSVVGRAGWGYFLQFSHRSRNLIPRPRF